MLSDRRVDADRYGKSPGHEHREAGERHRRKQPVAYDLLYRYLQYDSTAVGERAAQIAVHNVPDPQSVAHVYGPVQPEVPAQLIGHRIRLGDTEGMGECPGMALGGQIALGQLDNEKREHGNHYDREHRK